MHVQGRLRLPKAGGQGFLCESTSLFMYALPQE